LRLERLLALTCASVACVFGGGVAAPAHVRVRDTAAFIIVDAPPRPMDMYEIALRIPPKGSTGAYVHAGAEYGIVVAGQAQRWDAGRMRTMKQGDSFVSSAGVVSEIRASRGAVQISVFLEPRGVPPAATHAGAIFRNRFPVGSVPPTPFTLAEQLVDIPSGGSTIRFSYGGQAYCTIAQGELAIEKNGVLTKYRLGDSFIAAPGDTVRFVNAGPRLGSVQVAILLPEAVHLTHPPRAY
jgi:quercetin dioxygenase-like cupin family protein